MEPENLRQLRGSAELAANAVEAAVVTVAQTHEAIMRQVYAPFALLGPLAAPARVVEQIQSAITGQVYLTILSATQIVARGAVALIDRQAEHR